MARAIAAVALALHLALAGAAPAASRKAAAGAPSAEPAQGPAAEPAGGAGGAFELPVVLPEYATDEDDAYLCTSVRLPDRSLKLVGITSNSDQRIVHHMLLFGCGQPSRNEPVWNCRMMSACAGGSENVLYGWGKNAPAMAVPDGAGFSVGPGTSIRSVVLQMHYLHGRPANDTSGLTLRLSPRQVPHSAGMVAFAAGFTIPPRKPKTLVRNACCYSGWEPLHGFASRVHTHAMGREVYLDQIRPGAPKGGHMVSLDPQQPQGFYPIQPEATILPGDQLGMACRFDSSDKDHPVHAGSTHSDEMCNLYLMLYSQLPVFMWCLDGSEWVELDGAGGLPAGSTLVPETRVWSPLAAIQLDAKQAAPGFPLGQVPGLASFGDGTVWLFHRGDRAWQADGSVGNASTRATSSKAEGEALLAGPAVAQLDQDSGEVLRAWGAGAFALPHMITLDWQGNLWVTDVTLHQALKFSPQGEQLLALGTRLQKGSGPSKFCKPTQVAVARGGNVFVADGYCNSRVAEFNASGAWLRDYEVPKREGPAMAVPHSVVLHECREQLLVADREHGRVHAFQINTAEYIGHWDLKAQFGLPYALALGPYGSVLALTWQRDVAEPKTWLVALGSSMGAVDGHWEVPGVDVPHDLALTPAPLELTGAGERLLAVVVAETNDLGAANLHKFVFTPPGDQQSSGSGGSGKDAQAEGEGGHEAPGELPAYAAAGHGSRAHGKPETAQVEGEGAEGEPVGVQASHIGHVMLKPVDGGSGGSEGGSHDVGGGSGEGGDAARDAAQQDDADGVEETQQPSAATSGGKGGKDAAHIGHTMVKPVDEAADGAQAPADAADAAADGKQAASEEREVRGEQEAGEAAGKDKAASSGSGADGGDAEDEDGWQHLAEEGEQLMREAEAGEEAGGGESDNEAGEPQSAERPGVAAERQHKASAVAQGGEVDAEGWHPKHEQQALGHQLAQPWLVGAVFVGVALVSWNRLQHWRGHGGAGYHPPAHGHSV